MNLFQIDSFKKAVGDGKLDYLIAKWFIDIVNNEEVWALQHLEFDHIAVFEHSMNQGLYTNVQFLLRKFWHDEYIEFCKNDDDYLIDIVELYPEKYRLVFPHLQRESSISYVKRIFREHPMKLRSHK